VNAVRRQLRRRLPREVLTRAFTMGDILREIDKCPEDAIQRTKTMRHEYPVWGCMWNKKCEWILRCNRALPEPMLRVAFAQLMERHVALRAELRDNFALWDATQIAFTAFSMMRQRGSCGPMARLFQRATAWSFRHAWPRCGVGANVAAENVPLKVLPKTNTLEEAEQILWSNARGFKPPFRVSYVPFGKDSEPAALLHIAVTHMLSDGFSIMPLLTDLAHIVTSLETEAAHHSHLPPLPNMYEAMEPRLMRTIMGTPTCSADSITLETVGPERTNRSQGAFTVFVTIEHTMVQCVRAAAHILSVPFDIALLTIIGIALAWFENKRLETISMIVPQRDGLAENEMVGLFADFRHVNICTDGCNFVGVALELDRVVKERLWRRPGIATQFDLPMVNFEWTDFDEVGGFMQHISPFDRQENPPYPLKVAVEQPGPDQLRFRVAFRLSDYGEPKRDEFFRLLDKSFRAFLEQPLSRIWPDD
jgi:hypothetical protein